MDKVKVFVTDRRIDRQTKEISRKRGTITSNDYFVWQRITGEVSVPEMRIIMAHIVIESDLKWCIHLSRSFFLYMKRLKLSTKNQYINPLFVYFTPHFINIRYLYAIPFIIMSICWLNTSSLKYVVKLYSPFNFNVQKCL